MNPQLPLALKFSSDQRFALFVGDARAVAACRARALGEEHSPLLLQGAEQVGKTHLLLAACAEASQAGRRVRYLPLAALGERLQDAIDDESYADLIAVDQLDAAFGDAEAERALFRLHNRAFDARIPLIYASRLGPDADALALPDLRSRLGHCERVSLQPLEETQRREALRLRAAARGLELDDTAMEFLFRRIGRDLGTLTVLLDRLDRASLAAQRRLTVPFLKSVLGL